MPGVFPVLPAQRLGDQPPGKTASPKIGADSDAADPYLLLLARRDEAQIAGELPLGTQQ